MAVVADGDGEMRFISMIGVMGCDGGVWGWW